MYYVDLTERVHALYMKSNLQRCVTKLIQIIIILMSFVHFDAEARNIH